MKGSREQTLIHEKDLTFTEVYSYRTLVPCSIICLNPCLFFFFFWLHQVLVVAPGIFHCSTRALCFVEVCRLSCPAACGISVPQPGIEPASPALAGRFSTTAPPGKLKLKIFCTAKETIDKMKR